MFLTSCVCRELQHVSVTPLGLDNHLISNVLEIQLSVSAEHFCWQASCILQLYVCCAWVPTPYAVMPSPGRTLTIANDILAHTVPAYHRALPCCAAAAAAACFALCLAVILAARILIHSLSTTPSAALPSSSSALSPSLSLSAVMSLGGV